MSRKKKQEEQAPGAPPWMTTYGDMVTLLLCFFVMLLAQANFDEVRFREVLESFRGAFGPLEVDAESPTGQGPQDVQKPVTDLPKHTPEIEATLEKIRKIQQEAEELRAEQMAGEQIEEFREEIEQALKAAAAELGFEITDEPVQVMAEERGVVIRLQDQVLFELGKTEIRPGAQQILDTLATVLAEFNTPIRVEGHTDDIPIGWRLRGKYPTNWELSAARATVVLRYLLQAGKLRPENMSAAGYGEYRKLPRRTGETLDNYRQRLRRVDVVILRSGEMEPGVISDVDSLQGGQG